LETVVMETPSSPAMRFIVVVVAAMREVSDCASGRRPDARMALALKLIDFNGKA
jgi:hypothetical protein